MKKTLFTLVCLLSTAGMYCMEHDEPGLLTEELKTESHNSNPCGQWSDSESDSEDPSFDELMEIAIKRTPSTECIIPQVYWRHLGQEAHEQLKRGQSPRVTIELPSDDDVQD